MLPVMHCGIQLGQVSGYSWVFNEKCSCLRLSSQRKMSKLLHSRALSSILYWLQACHLSPLGCLSGVQTVQLAMGRGLWDASMPAYAGNSAPRMLSLIMPSWLCHRHQPVFLYVDSQYAHTPAVVQLDASSPISKMTPLRLCILLN